MKLPTKFLLHYLLKSGKNVKIPNRLISLPETCIYLKEDQTNILYLTDFLTHSVVGEYIFFPSTFDWECRKRSELYYSVGKAKLFSGINSETGEKIFYLEDKYEFYPWCGKKFHFKNCDCEPQRKGYGKFQQTFYFSKLVKKPLGKIIHKLFRWKIIPTTEFEIKISPDIYITFSWSFLQIIIEDYFWIDKGNPFYSFAIFDSNMKEIKI